MSEQLKNKKIGIIRSLDIRLNQAEFAVFFNKIKPKFIGDLNPEIKNYLEREKIDYSDLELTPAFLIDPIKILLGKTTHQSWLKFNLKALNEALSDISVLEIYEPYFFYSSQIASIAKKRGIPLVTEIWTSFANHPANFIPPYSLNVKNVISSTDLFILRSKKAATYLNSFQIDDGKKVIVYHGVNLKRFYPIKKQKREKIRILFVGVLAEHKGLDDLLAIFPSLCEKHKGKIELFVCGEGKLKERVIKMAEYSPINYLGRVSNLEIPQIYQEADIFCGPSKEYSFYGIKRWEEFVGYVFMEALASALPIVSTRCGGIPEIIGEDNLLIGEGNRIELFKCLDALMIDVTKRQKIGISNRKRAEKLFDLEKQVEHTEKILMSKFFTKEYI